MSYKDFAFGLAREAGDIIRANFTLGMHKNWKADNTPLTATDLKVNQLVIDAVHGAYPGHSILAEEGSDFSEASDYVWVCDPVDGTVPFSHGIPTCVFSLALVHRGVTLLGVIYDPFLNRMFVGEKNKGAFLNDVRLSVHTSTSLHNVVVGLAWWASIPFDYARIADALIQQHVKVLNLGSITYMGALVASGELVATIFPANQPHDTAALSVIVPEAGGKVTDLYGHEQRYDRTIRGHIISNGILHDELVELIQPSLREVSS